MDYKNILGIIATAVAIISYLPYFYGIYQGKTKPHAFTWLAWGSINIVSFAAVWISGAGTGSFILVVNILACLAIAIIAFQQGHVQYDLFDWLSLLGVGIGITLWWYTKNPLFAVILVSLSDAVGFIPTYRKGFRLPFEENISGYAIGVLYYVIGLFSFKIFIVTTWLYPVAVILLDGGFVILLLIRRRQVKKQNNFAK